MSGWKHGEDVLSPSRREHRDTERDYHDELREREAYEAAHAESAEIAEEAALAG